MLTAKVDVIKLPVRVVCNALFVNRNIVLLFALVSKPHGVNFCLSQRLVGFFLHRIGGSTDAHHLTYIQNLNICAGALIAK